MQLSNEPLPWQQFHFATVWLILVSAASHFVAFLSCMQNYYSSCFSCYSSHQGINTVPSTHVSVTVSGNAGMTISQSQQGAPLIRAQQDAGREEGLLQLKEYYTRKTKCGVSATFYRLHVLLPFSTTTIYIKLLTYGGLERAETTENKIQPQTSSFCSH